MSPQKRNPIRSKAITQAANGEACTVCGKNDGTTVFCHLNESWAGKGMGQKADDIAGFFGCFDCHQRYDNGTTIPRNYAETLMRAMSRTWVRLIELEVIIIKNRSS